MGIIRLLPAMDMDQHLEAVENRLLQIAREDFEVNGWRSFVKEWMLDYDGYFEEEEDNDDVEEENIEEDEGIGQETALSCRATLEASEVWQSKFCFVTMAVKIAGRIPYYLCGSCYFDYIDRYSIGQVEHTHIMEHLILTADYVGNRVCSACEHPLIQTIYTKACLICNN